MKTIEVVSDPYALATAHMVSAEWVLQWVTAFGENVGMFGRSTPEPSWLERYWRERIPYRHTPEQPVVSMMGCILRRYGACGDASAALAAAAAALRMSWELHVEMCDGGGYAHARTVIGGLARDPTAEASLAAPDRRVVYRPSARMTDRLDGLLRSL